MIDNKLVMGAVAGITVVAGAAVALWFNHVSWDATYAQERITQLTEFYNDAITEYPSDVANALFKFELSAYSELANFKAKYGEFPEYEAWEKLYRNKTLALFKAIRKG